MKKNLLTITILALGILNMILISIIVFTMVPNTIKTNKLIAKVAANIDLEIEPIKKEAGPDSIGIEDIEIYKIEDPLIINLKRASTDRDNHYVSVTVSLSMNTKSADYKTLGGKIADYETFITEIITDEFGNYTRDNVSESKTQIKSNILEKIQEKFESDIIINVSLGKFIVE